MKNRSLQNIDIKKLDSSSISNSHDKLKTSQSPHIENQENHFKIRSGSSKNIRQKSENQQNKRGGTPVQQRVSNIFTEKERILKKTCISNDVYIEIIEILSYQIVKFKCVDTEFKGKILGFIERNEPLKEIKSFMALTEIDEENNSGDLLRNKVRKKIQLIQTDPRIKLKSPVLMNKQIRKKIGTSKRITSAGGRKVEGSDEKFIMKESGELTQHSINSPVSIKNPLESTIQTQLDPYHETKVILNSGLSEENHSKYAPNAKKIPDLQENLERCEKISIPDTLCRNLSIPPISSETHQCEIKEIKSNEEEKKEIPSNKEEKKVPQVPLSNQESPVKRLSNRSLQGTRPPPLDFSKNKIPANSANPSNNSKILSPQLSPPPKTNNPFYTDIPKTSVQILQNPNEEKKKSFIPEPKTNQEKPEIPQNNSSDFPIYLPLNPQNHDKKSYEIFPSNINNPTAILDQTDFKNINEFTLGFYEKNTSDNILDPEQNTPRYFTPVEIQDGNLIENQSEIFIEPGSPKISLFPPPLIPKPGLYNLVPKMDLPPPPLIPKPGLYNLVPKLDLPPPSLDPLVLKPISQYPPVIPRPVQYPLVPNFPIPPPHLVPTTLQNPNTEVNQYQNPPSLIDFNNWSYQYQNSSSFNTQSPPAPNLVGNTSNFNEFITESSHNFDPGAYKLNTQADFYNKKVNIPPPPPLYAFPELYKKQNTPTPEVSETEKPQNYQYSNKIPEVYNQYKNDDKFYIPPPSNPILSNNNNNKETYFIPFPSPPTKIQQPQISHPLPLPGEKLPSSNLYNPQNPSQFSYQNPHLISKPIPFDEGNSYCQYEKSPCQEKNFDYYKNQLERENDLKIEQNLAYSQKDYRQKLCLICKEFKDRETFDVVICAEEHGNCQVCSFCRKKMKENCAVCYRKYSSYDKEVLDLL